MTRSVSLRMGVKTRRGCIVAELLVVGEGVGSTNEQGEEDTEGARCGGAWL